MNEINRDRITSIIINTIAGDALGTPLEGMSDKHIHSCFKEITGFTDPGNGIKNRPEKWKKPGLYSSISQFLILSALSTEKNSLTVEKFLSTVRSLPSLNDYTAVIRHPGIVETEFLEKMSQGSIINAGDYRPCARVLPVLVPFAFTRGDGIDRIREIIRFIIMFTVDTATIAGGIVYSTILEHCLNNHLDRSFLFDFAIDAISDITTLIENSSSEIFSLKVNPDDLRYSLERYRKLAIKLKSANSMDDASGSIAGELNKTLKTPVTRATVNHPLAILPYALYLNHTDKISPGVILFRSAMEGGSTAILTAITGSLSAALDGLYSQELLQGLVNKGRILSIAGAVSRGKTKSLSIDEFIKSESSLTTKFNEELKSKLKNAKKKTGNQDPKSVTGDRESRLNKHVVESWTKVDKARWKKERKKLDKNNI